MNRIKRFNEEYSPIPQQDENQIEVKVKDIIDFLSTLPPDATTDFHRGKWEYNGKGETGLDIIKNSRIFHFDREDNILYFTN